MSVASKYKNSMIVFIISFYLLINSCSLHANESTKEPPTISISLSDTVAQKEKTLLQKQVTSSASKENEVEDEKPGFLARYLPFLSTQKENNHLSSTEVNSPNSDHASLSGYKQKHSRKKSIFKNDYDDYFRKYSKQSFNHDEFWQWVRECKNPVYVSEYSAPADVIEIGSMSKRALLNHNVSTRKIVTERIFWNGKGSNHSDGLF